jgi:creatinine amidohydrolase
MRLQLCTWPEVENYLKTSRGIILPIGSTEQHGPNGLIGTDAICAEEIALAVGKATGALVGPTIGVGMAAHHMDFPGSMTLRPSTLMLVIRDYVTALAEHGFRRFMFVNGHGGNLATVRAAFQEIYAELRATQGPAAPELRCKVISWWENESVFKLSRELFGGAEGSHATPSEVSVVQYLYPDHIKTAPLNPAIAPSSQFFDARDYRCRFPDGRIGSNPGLATPEHGKCLFDAAVAALADKYTTFVNNED